MSHDFDPRPFRPGIPELSPLGILLRLRVAIDSRQMPLFCGQENFSVQELTSELAYTVSRLRVGSFSLRSRIEQAVTAVQVNVECGFFPLARKAALDLASLLAQARKRHLTNSDLSSRCANAALRIADLCGQEVR